MACLAEQQWCTFAQSLCELSGEAPRLVRVRTPCREEGEVEASWPSEPS